MGSDVTLLRVSRRSRCARLIVISSPVSFSWMNDLLVLGFRHLDLPGDDLLDGRGSNTPSSGRKALI